MDPCVTPRRRRRGPGHHEARVCSNAPRAGNTFSSAERPSRRTSMPRAISVERDRGGAPGRDRRDAHTEGARRSGGPGARRALPRGGRSRSSPTCSPCATGRASTGLTMIVTASRWTAPLERFASPRRRSRPPSPSNVAIFGAGAGTASVGRDRHASGRGGTQHRSSREVGRYPGYRPSTARSSPSSSRCARISERPALSRVSAIAPA